MQRKLPNLYLIVICCFGLLQTSCVQAGQQTDPIEATTPSPSIDFRQKPDLNYTQTKEHIAQQRQELKLIYANITSDSLKNALLDSAGLVFTDIIVHQLLPYWYGTKWTFEGHTDIPNQGEIACGYLVSTTLKHAGLNLNRYKLAQQAASIGLKSIAFGKDVLIYRGLSPEELEQKFISQHQPGLYKVGLDYHVGYLYFTGTELYFLHSSYGGPVAVTVERVTDSPVFSSSAYHILDITHNRGLMKRWLTGEEIPIVK